MPSLTVPTDDIAKVKPRAASVHAVITRANGNVEDYGMISYYHRNPLRSWAVNIAISVRRFVTRK